MNVRHANGSSCNFSYAALFRQWIVVLIALSAAACGEGSGGDGSGGGAGLGSGPPSVGGGGGQGGIGTGQIDRSFGTDGGTITPIGGGDSFANAVVVQPDGRIVLVGASENTGGNGETAFALARYSAAGALDESFGAGGKVTSLITNPSLIGGSNAIANAVALQGDRRIVASGQSTGAGGGDDFALARYNTDGTLDATFGTDGVVVTSLSPGDDRLFGIAIQGDQKIVVAGEAGGQFALARYNGDGTLDTSFSSDGIVLTDAGAGDDRILSMALQTDGKIVVAGSSGGALALARYQTNGLLDPAFGGGIVRFDVTGGVDMARALRIQGENVVVGVANDGTDNDFMLLRYTNAGILDARFGLDGIVRTHLAGDDQINDLVLHPSGKITAVGFTQNGEGNNDFAVVGYMADGTLDPYFGVQGVVVTPISDGDDDEARAVAIQSGGEIVVTGSAASNFVVVRYLPPL